MFFICKASRECSFASRPWARPSNNGNVVGQTQMADDSLPLSQTPVYDGVNRLTTAGETAGGSESCGYDARGNRWMSGGEPTQR